MVEVINNKNMRKITILVTGLILLAPIASFASSILFNPGSGSYQAGQVLSVNVLVDPQGATLYTVSAHVKYPADLLEVKLFTFAASWIPLAQPGYDLVDNNQGVLIKTGGYPGGLSTKQSLGTITFRAKKAGSASLSFGGDSIALDSSNTNVLSPVLPRALFSFVAPALKANAPAQEKEPVEISQSQEGAEEVLGLATVSFQAHAPIEAESPLGPLSLAAISVLAVFDPMLTLIAVLAILVLIFFLGKRNKKNL